MSMQHMTHNEIDHASTRAVEELTRLGAEPTDGLGPAHEAVGLLLEALTANNGDEAMRQAKIIGVEEHRYMAQIARLERGTS